MVNLLVLIQQQLHRQNVFARPAQPGASQTGRCSGRPRSTARDVEHAASHQGFNAFAYYFHEFNSGFLQQCGRSSIVAATSRCGEIEGQFPMIVALDRSKPTSPAPGY